MESKENKVFLEEVKSYMPLIFLFPIFLAGSSSVIIYMSTVALATSDAIPDLKFLNTIIVFAFHFLSYLISWSLLSFLYIYLPNTKVPWKAGFIAGNFTGMIYFIWQWIYVTFHSTHQAMELFTAVLQLCRFFLSG